jgi:hypothetical protein
MRQEGRLAETLVTEKAEDNSVKSLATALVTESVNAAQSKDSDKIMIRGLVKPGANQIHAAQSKESDNIQIRGRVISGEDQLPISGAVIFLRGSNVGTITDLDGRFELQVPDSGSIIQAVFIGMETAEIKAGEIQDGEIILDPSELALNEVVVIGYGSKRKSETSGAVSEIIPDAHQQIPGYKAATPVTGKRAFNTYIRENQIFPEGTGMSRAVVVIAFKVGKNGRPENIEIVRSPQEPFSWEAIRLLKNGPDWQPAMSGDNILDDNVQVRIILRKDN